MLQALEDIKAHAWGMLAKFREGARDAEDDLINLVLKIEHAIGIHKAATEEPSAPEPSPEPKEILPAGYPPITPS